MDEIAEEKDEWILRRRILSDYHSFDMSHPQYIKAS